MSIRPFHQRGAICVCLFLAFALHLTSCSLEKDATAVEKSKDVSEAEVPVDVTPQQAKDVLASSGNVVYLDVRTVAEFEAGHPPHAWNVPVLFRNAETGKHEQNAAFMSIVEKEIPKDTRIVVGCRSGSRSKRAQKMMQAAGFARVSNMLGGFFGKKKADGSSVQPGWSELGLEVETGDGGEHSYVKLQAKAGG